MYEVGLRLPGGEGPPGNGIDHGQATKGLTCVGEELSA